MKYDKEKPKYRFVYTSLLNEVAKVRAFGNIKYPNPESWFSTEPIQHLEAAERHIRAIMDGEDFDKESKLLHLAHVACNVMFEIERIKREEKKIKKGRGFAEPHKVCLKNAECVRTKVLENGEEVII